MSEVSKDLSKQSLTELMQQLEAIVDWFNAGEVDIEQATTKFDEGVALADAIKAKLAETGNRVNQIKLKLDKVAE